MCAAVEESSTMGSFDRPEVNWTSGKMTCIPRSSKTLMYLTGLCLACVTGYLYGNINRDATALQPFASSTVVISGRPRQGFPGVARSLQAHVPFGICEEGEDCTVMSAEDVVIQSHDSSSSAVSLPIVQKDDQGARKESIRRMCRQYANLTEDELSTRSLKQLIVDDEHEVVYCSIPKAGCTNWKRLLLAANNNSIDLRSISKDYAHHNKVLKTLYEYSESERSRILKYYQKFTFVRNPFIRLLSAYKDKFEYLWQYRDDPNGVYFRRYAAEIMTKFRKDATGEELRSGENVTWTEFVLYVTHLPSAQFNAHWTPMYKLCSPCLVDYDFIGRIETIDVDAHDLLTRVLKMDHTPKKFPHYFDLTTNSSRYTYSAYGDVTVQQLRILWNIFKWDFWLFGYKKPDFI